MLTGKTKDRWVRLFSMSADELLERSGQEMRARADALRHRVGMSFPVKLRSAEARSKPRFFFAREDVPGICDLLRRRLPGQADEIIRRAERICQHRFDLLGYENLDYGSSIDWHCDRVHGKRAPRKPFYRLRYLDFAECGDVKVTWELNRHQHFVILAKAYRLTGNEKFVAELLRQWEHWQAENPYPIGINWASSLEVAFRSWSWLWAYYLVRDCGLLPQDFRGRWLTALGISGRHIERYLSTYFSPNTHLLGEAVGLFFIGVLCPELKSAAKWREQGWEIVLQEANRQVRPDGVHFEQSTHYHVYALDLFLHARILASLNDTTVPPRFDQILEKMLHALSLLGRAGTPLRFGDDDGGRLFDGQRNRAEHLLDPLAAGAVLFGRGDFKSLAGSVREETLWLLGADGAARFDALEATSPSANPAALDAAGLYLMPHADSASQLVIDAGPQGTGNAGHGHADALSVCVNGNGVPLFIDPGTLEYVGEGSEREYFRGTAAHNTLRVDKRDQAEVKGAFAWANLPQSKAELWINGKHFGLFAGCHNGYSRLPQPVLHRRWVFSLEPHFWLVRDVVEGSGEHRLDLSWHLAPRIMEREGPVLAFETEDGKAGISLLTVEGHGWQQQVSQGVFSPAYGRKQAATELHFSAAARLPAEFVTLLQIAAASRTAELVRLEAGVPSSVRGYRYRTEDEEHSIIFARAGMPWSLGAWASDCEFLYWGERREGQRSLIFCNGSYVEIGGKRVVSCIEAITCYDAVAINGREELFSSDEGMITNRLPLNSIGAEFSPAVSINGRTG